MLIAPPVMSPPTRFGFRSSRSSVVSTLARRDERSEAGREPLDLSLDPLGHVRGRSVRHVAVRPRRVPAGRSARLVEQARLGEQDERTVCVPPLPRSPLRGGDLVERAADVDGAGVAALGRRPRDRAVERPVDLEDARPVAPAREPLSIPAVGEPCAGEAKEPGGRDIAEDDARPRDRQAIRSPPRCGSRRRAHAARPRARRRSAATLRVGSATPRHERSAPARGPRPPTPSARAVGRSARPARRRGRGRARPGTCALPGRARSAATGGRASSPRRDAAARAGVAPGASARAATSHATAARPACGTRRRPVPDRRR